MAHPKELDAHEDVPSRLGSQAVCHIESYSNCNGNAGLRQLFIAASVALHGITLVPDARPK